MIVIDPYRTRTAALADEHWAIRPGTDSLLALSLMHALFREGFADEEYLQACAHGWEELRAHALKPEHAPALAAQITGIAEENIEALARAYGQAGRAGRKPAAIRMNYGIQRSENGGTAARAVAMMPLITGSWKQRGGGLLLSTSGAFPFASNKLQMPELMQASPLGRPARMINMNELGWALTELGQKQGSGPRVQGPEDVPVKALFVYNCNAAAVAPDSERVLAGLRRDDLFTVVHEQFFTDTTDYADIVLPATTFLEHKELMGAYGHYLAQISEAAIAPLGEARTNVWLFAELGRRMGFAESAFTDGDDDLIAQALDSGHPWLAGITRERLEVEKQIPLDMPKNAAGQVLPFSDATWFRHAHGKAELLPVPTFVPPQESAASADKDARFPLQFLPRKADNYMNTTFANLEGHRDMERRTNGLLEIHAVDAASRGICDGDSVRIWNDRGHIELQASVSQNGNARVSPGVVAARLDWHKLSPGGMNVNALTSQRLTDIGGGATFYSVLVEVSKVQAPKTFSGVAAD